MNKIIKSRKTVYIIIIVIGIIFSSYIAAASMNYVPFPGLNSVIIYPASEKIAKITVGTMVNDLTIDIEEIDDIEDLDTNLELEIFGSEEDNIDDIYDWYLERYRDDGWSEYKNKKYSTKNSELYYTIWTKGIMVQATFIGQGKAIDKYTDYDTLIGSIITNGLPLM